MSTVKTSLQVAGVVALAAAAGTAYVLIHEHRRKAKKERKKAEGPSDSGAGTSNALLPDKLIALLSECANAAYQLIEQTRKMVHEKHVQTGAALESCVDELQRDFESAMEAVMSSIRAKHGVTEQAMSAAMAQYQSHADVAAAVNALREAMGGKAPPGYGKASEAAASEAAKQRVRRNKGRRKG